MAKKRIKEKKQKKPKKPRQLWKKYKVSGDKLEADAKFCPKCGTGNFLAKHQNRLTCGKCNYTEFVK